MGSSSDRACRLCGRVRWTLGGLSIQHRAMTAELHGAAMAVGLAVRGGDKKTVRRDGTTGLNIILITTGGTIAKTYDERAGALRNERPVVETILARLRLPDLLVTYEHVVNKDSLDFSDADRALIVETVRRAAGVADAVVVAHGTDTLEVTGELLCRELGDPRVPVVLTGAMRPYEFRDTDATQNVTEALLACRLIGPGVYAVMHNRVLRFPGVRKDRQTGSFVKGT